MNRTIWKRAMKVTVGAMLIAVAYVTWAMVGMSLASPMKGQGGSQTAYRGSEAGDRDKTGTNADPENKHGSQSVEIQHLTSRCSFEAEDMGF